MGPKRAKSILFGRFYYLKTRSDKRVSSRAKIASCIIIVFILLSSTPLPKGMTIRTFSFYLYSERHVGSDLSDKDMARDGSCYFSPVITHDFIGFGWPFRAFEVTEDSCKVPDRNIYVYPLAAFLNLCTSAFAVGAIMTTKRKLKR